MRLLEEIASDEDLDVDVTGSSEFSRNDAKSSLKSSDLKRPPSDKDKSLKSKRVSRANIRNKFHHFTTKISGLKSYLLSIAIFEILSMQFLD